MVRIGARGAALAAAVTAAVAAGRVAAKDAARTAAIAVTSAALEKGAPTTWTASARTVGRRRDVTARAAGRVANVSARPSDRFFPVLRVAGRHKQLRRRLPRNHRHHRPTAAARGAPQRCHLDRHTTLLPRWDARSRRHHLTRPCWAGRERAADRAHIRGGALRGAGERKSVKGEPTTRHRGAASLGARHGCAASRAEHRESRTAKRLAFDAW